MRIALSALLGLASAACGESPDRLELFFADELVEAPARSIHLVLVADTACATLSAFPHEQLSSAASITLERSGPYPHNPESNILEGAPRGKPIALDIVALDKNNLLVGRGCLETIIPLDAPAELRLELRAGPLCEIDPIALDLEIIMDASTALAVVDGASFEGETIPRLTQFFAPGSFPADTRFSLILHGQSAPTETVQNARDPGTIQEALSGLPQGASGDAQHFAAASLGAAYLRARAVCGRQPVLLVIGAGLDRSEIGAFEEAQLRMVGTRGDSTDDLMIFGLALSADGRGELNDLILPELGELRTALTNRTLSEALTTIGMSIRNLLVR